MKNFGFNVKNIVFSISYPAHFLKSRPINITQILKFYRELQLIGIQVNICFRTMLFPCLLAGCSIEVILSLYITIRFHSQLGQSPLISVFPLILLNSFVATFLGTSIAANVNSKSSKLVERLMIVSKSRRNTLMRRKIDSLFPISVRFSSNFVDNTTPIIILHFCIEQAVSLLIASE